MSTDEQFETERQTLMSLWNEFIQEGLFLESNHIHAPINLHSLYDHVIAHDLPISAMLDLIFRFAQILASKGILYDNLVGCNCFKLTDEDIDSLLKG